MPNETHVEIEEGVNQRGVFSARKPILIMAGLVLFFLLVHFPLIKEHSCIGKDCAQRRSLEDRSIKVGDFTYYLHGALSLFDFSISRKFNDKHYPIIGQQRRITEEDMPWYAKYLLIAYPNPSFKFGYSLTAAVLSAPFPERWFQYHIPRLVFVNIILIIMTLLLIFLIMRRLTKNDIAALIPCLIFILDVSNAHNSYNYQSHTMSGIFYLLLSYYLFIQTDRPTPLRLGLIAFILVFSALSSSHTLAIAAALGLFIYLYTCYRNFGNDKFAILQATIASLIGCSIWPLYIFGVEKLFKFQAIGLPTTLAQLNNYRATVNLLIETYPIHLRFMWDPRIFNVFAFIILALMIALFIARAFFLGPKSKLLSRQFPLQEPGSPLRRKYHVLLFSLVAATGISAFHTQPVSRAMTPYTVMFGILFGVLMGRQFTIGNRFMKGIVGLILMLVGLNFYLMFQVIRLRAAEPSGVIFNIDESEAINRNTAQFFQTLRAGTYEYKVISKSIGDFVEKYDSVLRDNDRTYIRFDAMDLVTAYTSTRRFISRFVPNKNDVVTSKTLLRDFRFLAEVFNLQQKGFLGQSDIIQKRKRIWNFAVWDQEYNYIFGYSNRIKKYLTNTPLESLDPRYIYFINYGGLKRAFITNGGEILLPPIAFSENYKDIIHDKDMSDSNWPDHQTPELNHRLKSAESDLYYRHVKDSKPSFGGIIYAYDFPLEGNKEYLISFKIKVIQGVVNMQLIQNFGGTPVYRSFGGINDREWTTKEYNIISESTSLQSRINFTNNFPDSAAEFYIGDVRIQRILED